MALDMVSLRKQWQRKSFQKYIPPDKGKQGRISRTVDVPREDDKLVLINQFVTEVCLTVSHKWKYGICAS